MLARVIFHVQDSAGAPIGGVLLSASSDFGPWLGRTNDEGNFDANPGLSPGHYEIVFSKAGFADRKLPADIKDPGTIVVGLDSAVASGLHVEGQRFVLNGQEWRMVFADSFRAYERFIKQGPDSIRPVFAELQSLGANGIRVLGAFDFGSPNQQRLYPSEHADYYDRLPDFFNLAGEYGLFVQFCVFADTQRSIPGGDVQRNHYSHVCNTLRGVPNVLLQLVNEGNQHENGLSFEASKPAGLLASSGSHGTGDDPPQPFWDYSDLGSERRGDFALSTTTVNFAIKGYGGENGNPGFPGTQRATVVSEPPGFGEVGSGSRTNDPRIAFLLGLGTKWGAGGCAHSDCGIQSIPLTPTQRECVRQFILGAK